MAKWVSLTCADLFDYLPTLDADSIDSAVVDPPYGIGFMGREWDTFRAGTEQKRHVASRVRESNNPNLRGRQRAPASSPSAVEYDRSLRGQVAFEQWTEAWAREVWRVLKPGAHLVVCGAPRSAHRMTCGIEDAGFEIRDCLMWLFGQGFPKSKNLRGEWEGWGTALKPGWEPIVLARKPLSEKTLQANVERWGTGLLNIDVCRISLGEEKSPAAARRASARASGNAPMQSRVLGVIQARDAEALGKIGRRGSADVYMRERKGEQLGRWPANVLHDGSGDVINCFPNAPGQLANASTSAPSAKTSNVYGKMQREGEASATRRYTNNGGTNFAATPGQRRFDEGSAARFFYCAKASKADREDGCVDLPARTAGEVTGGRKEGSAGLDSPRAGAGRTSGARNFHPTVKPTALMRWLVRLVTPKGGVVLDCFLGSGSTGRAAVLEQCAFIGVEREAEFMPIAKARIAAAKAKAKGAA